MGAELGLAAAGLRVSASPARGGSEPRAFRPASNFNHADSSPPRDEILKIQNKIASLAETDSYATARKAGGIQRGLVVPQKGVSQFLFGKDFFLKL